MLFQIPAGWLVDKVGAKRGMLFDIVLWSAMTLLMGGEHLVSFAFVALLALRFLPGIMESPVGPASDRVIAAWFRAPERGIAGAIFNSAQYVSRVVFTPLISWLAPRFGWQHVFGMMGSIGPVFGLVWGRIYYAPLSHPTISKEELDYMQKGGALVSLGENQKTGVKESGSSLADIGSLFRSRMLAGILIAQYCITSITWFFVSWFPSYLVKCRGLLYWKPVSSPPFQPYAAASAECLPVRVRLPAEAHRLANHSSKGSDHHRSGAKRGNDRL